MTSRGRRLVMAAVALPCCTALVSCVALLGDDFTVEPVAPTATGGTGGSTASGGTTTSVGGGGEAPGGSGGTGGSSGGGPSCEPPLELCGEQCIDTRSAATDCGACGHDCGGGQCALGHCQPMVLHDGLATAPYGVAAAGNAVFWVRFGAVESCPASGCDGSAPTMISPEGAPTGTPLTGTTIVADGNFVQWLGYDTNQQHAGYPGPALYSCHAAGCAGYAPTFGCATAPMKQIALRGNQIYTSIGSPGGAVRTCTIGSCSGDPISTIIPNSMVDPGFGITADDTFIYFTAGADPAYGGAIKCPLTGCPTPSSARIQLFTDARFIAVADGMLYGSRTNDTIVSCDAVNGCGGIPTVLATDQAGVTALVAQGDVLVYSLGGATDSATGEIRGCSLPGCVGGPVTLVSAQPRPVSLALRDGFVYWANAGLDGSVETTASIQRMRL